MKTTFKQQKNEDGEIVTYVMGVCPHCGSENIDYGPIEPIDSEWVYYPMNCLDCKKNSKEWYKLKFTDTIGD